MADGDGTAKKSDLGIRVLSAIVMVAIAGTALWLGGWVWTLFVAIVALGVLWEWAQLSGRFANSQITRFCWILGGLVYIGPAALALWFLRHAPSLEHQGIELVLTIVAPVIATDVGAYFAGRALGGPKIAPAISPSKTWSGLFGGMVASAAVLVVPLPWYFHDFDWSQFWDIAMPVALIGGLIAILAQAGDFFESWMKRRAGVKDSGRLIPGHGGLFDRVDGLLAVLFVAGALMLSEMVAAIASGEGLLPTPA